MNILTRRLLALSAAGAVTIGVGTALAQAETKPSAPQAPSARRGGHKMRFQALNLTEEQKAQVKELHQKARERRQEIQASTASDDEKKQQLAAARKEQREAFLKLLSPEQRDKMTEMRRSQGMRMGRAGRLGRTRFGGRGFAFPGMARLNLTEDQKAKLKVAHEQYEAQVQSILTPEQRAQAQQLRGRFGRRMRTQPVTPPAAEAPVQQ
jgi:periplasmic protein CpxP/Spy